MTREIIKRIISDKGKGKEVHVRLKGHTIDMTLRLKEDMDTQITTQEPFEAGSRLYSFHSRLKCSRQCTVHDPDCPILLGDRSLCRCLWGGALLGSASIGLWSSGPHNW
jgi:hypothetical protein